MKAEPMSQWWRAVPLIGHGFLGVRGNASWKQKPGRFPPKLWRFGLERDNHYMFSSEPPFVLFENAGFMTPRDRKAPASA